MIVIHVVRSLDVGGLERNVINQVREGQKLGQIVTVVCLERPGELAPRAEALGARVLCVHKRPGVHLTAVRTFKTIFRELKPDVVHTHEIGSLFYGGPAARAVDVPLVVHTEHGAAGYKDRFRLRFLGRLAGRYAERFFCLTQELADSIITHRIVPRTKVSLISNGIDVASFQEPYDTRAIRKSLGIPLDAPLIGTVGRLAEIKRQDLLIRAFARIRQQVPDSHLLLVGDGPLLRVLHDLALDLGISDSVHFAGYHPDSAPFLQTMDVFALTSRSEGMPQALLEALVVGLPVIATRVGGIPEIIENGRTGLLFDSGEEVALTAGLCELLTNRDRALAMGQAGRSLVECRFDVARMAREYHEHFLDSLVGRKIRPSQPVSSSA